MKPQISVIGCGWLGFPLAIHLINKGFTVKGSTTSKEKLTSLKNEGIIPYQIALDTNKKINDDITGFLAGSNILIINIPPGLRKQPNKDHVREISNLVPHIKQSPVKHILYVSSTSVFEDQINIPTFQLEDHPETLKTSENQLIKIENLLKTQPDFKTTIVRFGGLFDETRHPARFLSGRTGLKNANAPINLIHKYDCIAIMSKIITSQFWNKTLNLAYPFHPNKKIYYTGFCKLHDIPAPEFDTETPSKGKLIDSSKIKTVLDMSFRFKP